MLKWLLRAAAAKEETDEPEVGGKGKGKKGKGAENG